MGDFPRLHHSGLVEWPDDASMRAQWPATLGRGALIVRPDTALAALAIVDIVIDVVGSPQLTARAEVVRIEPERTLLRLLDGPLPLPPPAPVNPFASRSIAVPSSLTPMSDEMPAPTPAPRPLTPAPATSSSSSPAISAPAIVAAPSAAIVLEPEPPDLEPRAVPELEPRPSSSSFSLSPPATSSSPPTSSLPPTSSPVPSSSFSLSPPTPTELRPATLPSSPPTRAASSTFDARAPSRRFADPPDDVVTTRPDADDPFSSLPSAPTVSRKLGSDTAPVPSLSTARVPSLSTSMSPSARFDRASSETSMIDSAPLRAAMPAVFTGDALRFGSTAELQAARRDLVGVGAVLAICDGAVPPGVVEVRLIAGSAFSQTKVKCTFAPAAPGTVVVQAARKEDWRIPLAELDANSTGPVSIVSSSSSVTLTLPLSGTLTNPVTPRGIMMLPVHRGVTEADLRQPSVPLFLRWLRTTKGVFRVELSCAGQPVHTLVVVDGREVRAPIPLATLGKALANHTYTYTMTELPRAPTLSTTGRTLHLIVDVLRALLAPHDLDEIAAAFPHSKDQRLVRAVGAVADALGFTGPLARLIKSNLQGDDTVRGVTRAAIGARAVWDVLVPLELFAGLTLAPGEPRRHTPNEAVSGVGSQSGAPVVPGEPFTDKDHFAVLGLHWSASPSAVVEAHVKVRRDFLPGGSRRPLDDGIAARALKRIDEAFAVLGVTDKRQAYRRATFNMVWPHQATLLVQQAKLAIYRKDLSEARDLLAAAQDISPSTEAGVLLDTLNRTS